MEYFEQKLWDDRAGVIASTSWEDYLESIDTTLLQGIERWAWARDVYETIRAYPSAAPIHLHLRMAGAGWRDIVSEEHFVDGDTEHYVRAQGGGFISKHDGWVYVSGFSQWVNHKYLNIYARPCNLRMLEGASSFELLRWTVERTGDVERYLVTVRYKDGIERAYLALIPCTEIDAIMQPMIDAAVAKEQ